MSFATSPKQHTTTAAATSTSTTTTAASPATVSSTRSNNASSPSYAVQLPNKFTTAQNCASSFWPQQQQQQEEQQQTPTTSKSTLMIKNTELSANQTDWDEKEEEKEICNVLQRRESVPEDATVTNSGKLNTIEETFEINNTSTPLLQRRESLSIVAADTTTTANNTTTTTPATTATTSTSSVPIEEQQQQQQQQKQHEITTTSSIETLNTSAAPSTTTTTPELVNSINQLGGSDNSTTTTRETEIAAAATTTITTTTTTSTKTNKTASPSDSPHRKNSSGLKGKLSKTPSFSKLASAAQNTSSGARVEEDTVSKSSDTSGELVRGVAVSTTTSTCTAATPESFGAEKPKSASRLSERAKKKSWYNVLYPNYKSRSQDFKKLFKEVPNDERLIVDYSCALQRDILVQGRLYVSQNYVCFHANIFRWETYLSIKWRDVTSITKEKTALVIPNAISICTAKEKYFFATFTSRDKSFLMLFRVWQNTLMNKQMPAQEIWQWVHNCYGDELGLTTDDEDYIDPTTVPAASTLTENESDLDFVSALDDSSINTTLSIAGSDYCTAATSISNQSINQIALPVPLTATAKATTTTSSGTSSGGGGGGIRKSKSKLYFFNSNKSSHINSSTTASASGSDNKTSDNNSGADSNTNNKNSSKNSSSNKKSSQMKPNAKELTLNTAKPEEGSGAATAAATAASTSSSTAVPQQNVNGVSDAKSAGAGSAATKELKASSSASLDGKRKVSKNSRQRDESLNKNSEALPTDMSDSSDSDENKIPFVSTVECTSTHEGRQMMHTILPINIETLFNLLFSKSKFLTDFHAMRKSTDTNFADEWYTNEEGQRVRVVNVTVQLAASVGPKTSKVTEYQTMRECSKPGELYSIDINSVNAGIPYADSFSVQMHNCLVRTIDDHTMLSVHAQIKYKKSIWGVVKGFIEKNTWAGLEDFYGALLHALQSETCIPPAKGKGRRPRRGTAAQVRPIEEAPAAQIKAESTECEVLATHAIAPHLLPAVSQTKLLGAGVAPSNRYKWLSLFVIVLLFFLIVLNVILLFKLWKLEDRIEDDLNSRARMPNLSALKQLPSTHQEWIELLRHQEILHETELRKWHKVLQTAIELLKKTEKTLAELMFR